MSINTAVRDNIESAIVEMGSTHKERLTVIKGIWVAVVAKQHFLMLGPGGTGKSFLIRDLTSRILGSTLFETQVDETSDPAELLGPVDIRGMKEHGHYRRRTDGFLPTSDFGFIDEFFNSNGPTRHAIMKLLNERMHQEDGHSIPAPLWSAFMGTNKLDADADQAAVWDRIHQRHVIRYVQDRDNIRDMVADSILRRTSDYTEPEKATVKLNELKEAHDEAMRLEVSDNAWDTFLDIKEELLHSGVEVGSRRIAEGMAAVLANAWVNGHEQVTVGDLDVLQHLWWINQSDIESTQKIILGVTNPGEKAALEFLDELEKYRADIRAAQEKDLDDTKKRLVGMEVFKNCKRILQETEDLEEKAKAAGAGTTRIIELRTRTQSFLEEVQSDFFNL